MTVTSANDQDIDQERLTRVLREVPKGALALSLLAVGLLLAGWFFVYLAIFIPRGTVG
jgi:hypothetical protein